MFYTRMSEIVVDDEKNLLVLRDFNISTVEFSERARRTRSYIYRCLRAQYKYHQHDPHYLVDSICKCMYQRETQTPCYCHENVVGQVRIKMLSLFKMRKPENVASYFLYFKKTLLLKIWQPV